MTGPVSRAEQNRREAAKFSDLAKSVCDRLRRRKAEGDGL
jgi:hypothetical protein